MNNEVSLCQVVNGQRVYPRVIIWLAGEAIASGGLEALSRPDASCERVFARTWRDSAIASFYWHDGAWSSVAFRSMMGLRIWCRLLSLPRPEVML